MTTHSFNEYPIGYFWLRLPKTPKFSITNTQHWTRGVNHRIPIKIFIYLGIPAVKNSVNREWSTDFRSVLMLITKDTMKRTQKM
ncbi:hypothetical protein A9F06_05285 [Klebsiella pneumoniae]|nr:hypothetical protein A9F06_05285 [Klebsiella pneumoniae]